MRMARLQGILGTFVLAVFDVHPCRRIGNLAMIPVIETMERGIKEALA